MDCLGFFYKQSWLLWLGLYISPNRSHALEQVVAACLQGCQVRGCGHWEASFPDSQTCCQIAPLLAFCFPTLFAPLPEESNRSRTPIRPIDIHSSANGDIYWWAEDLSHGWGVREIGSAKRGFHEELLFLRIPPSCLSAWPAVLKIGGLTKVLGSSRSVALGRDYLWEASQAARNRQQRLEGRLRGAWVGGRAGRGAALAWARAGARQRPEGRRRAS